MKNRVLLGLLLAFFCYNPFPVRAQEQRPQRECLYKYQIAAVLIFQNEAAFLKEWIEYHKLIGVEHFYLFDNASTDHFMEVLEPYVASGEVELFHDPRISKNQQQHNTVQCGSYMKAIKMAKGKVKWLLICDADEFVVPLKSNSLLPILNKYSKYGGVYVNWLMFGHSNVLKVPQDRLMIEMLNMCLEAPTNLGKSIVRPERVKNCTDPHRMWYHEPYIHVNTDYKTFDWVAPIADDKLIIHHYCFGDLDHLINVKIPRRKKWLQLDPNEYIQFSNTYNVRKNTTMMRFVPALRKRMGLP